MNTSQLDRRLGLPEAFHIGVASMVGAGVFAVFAPAAGAAGPALLIGLVIIGSIFIVHPIVQAITKIADAHQNNAGGLSPAEVQQLEARIGSLEETLHRVLEAQEFERALKKGGF